MDLKIVAVAQKIVAPALLYAAMMSVVHLKIVVIVQGTVEDVTIIPVIRMGHVSLGLVRIVIIAQMIVHVVIRTLVIIMGHVSPGTEKLVIIALMIVDAVEKDLAGVTTI